MSRKICDKIPASRIQAQPSRHDHARNSIILCKNIPSSRSLTGCFEPSIPVFYFTFTFFVLDQLP